MTRTLRYSALGLCAATSAVLLFGAPRAAAAEDDLRLVPAESSVQFVGIKNDSVAVPGRFVGLSGGVDTRAGSAWLQVHLTSLQTGDAERDQNIMKHFFGVAEFPLARFDIEQLPSALTALASGSSAEFTLTGVLDLHGTKIDLHIPVRISNEDVGYRVQTAAPLVLDAVTLGMAPQVATLKAVCGHASLDSVYPLNVSLLFRR